VLERGCRKFRLFLKAMEGDVCPFCGVIGTLERERMDRFCRRLINGDRPALCARHLQLALEVVAARGTRVRTNLVRAVVCSDVSEKGSLQVASCQICDSIETVMRRLVRAVRRLNDRIRFEKALARAPLFCRLHAAAVVTEGSAPTFARIQGEKLKQLDEDLLQAMYRDSDRLEQLIADVMIYVAGAQASGRGRTGSGGVEPFEDEPPAAEDPEFERWDSQQVLKHLNDLETEVAKLRYLVDENRGLKLARAAVEATRRDLERERQTLRQGADGSSKAYAMPESSGTEQ
jgi:hypothetical protein